MITHAQELPFTYVRRLVQSEARAVGVEISNRKSKDLAQAIRNKTTREAFHNDPDKHRNFNHQDPVGEKVIRRVMAVMYGYEPEPV